MPEGMEVRILGLCGPVAAEVDGVAPSWRHAFRYHEYRRPYWGYSRPRSYWGYSHPRWGYGHRG
jgi:hypothetical protein